MADPASHTAVISWITEELKRNKLRQEGRHGKTNQITLLPEPAERIGVCQKWLAGNHNGNVRFPWIHNKDPVDFHLIMIWP